MVVLNVHHYHQLDGDAPDAGEATVPEAVVDDALAAAEGDARVALVTLLAGVDAAAARERLERAQGSVRGALA